MTEIEVPSQLLRIGQENRLRVERRVSIGVYLSGLDEDDLLLPNRYVPPDCAVGDYINVFVYLDSEDRLIATTETPLARVGELAYLEVVAVNRTGAFLDWGLPKDLLLPFREQREGMERGRRYIVYVYLDSVSQRPVASARLNKRLPTGLGAYKPGDAVELVICGRTELGYEVIIDRRRVGMVYANEIFQPLEEGQSIGGYIKQVRPDGKIDVTLQRSGVDAEAGLAAQILAQLQAAGGFLPLTDKTPPEAVYERFRVSKKVYKRVVGKLYKARKLRIEDDGLHSV